MLADVLLHFGLECVGAAGFRWAAGLCADPRARLAAWLPFGLLTSYVTVSLVG